MEIRIIVHGVTTGHDSTEKTPSPYIQNFYNRQNNTDCFISEIVRGNNGLCSCYTLYVSRNVSNYGNRPGAYFGITVIIEGKVCSDIKALYSSLSGVFRSSFVGKLLDRQGDGYKFRIPRFAEEEAYISGIINGLFLQIQNTLRLNLVDLDGSFTTAGNAPGKTVACNPADLPDDKIVDILRRDGSIIISDEIPLASYQKQIEAERKKRELEISAVRSEQQKQLEQERARRERDAKAAALREQQIAAEAKAEAEARLRQKEAAMMAERKSCSAEIAALKAQIASKESTIREYNEEYKKLADIAERLNIRISGLEKSLANIPVQTHSDGAQSSRQGQNKKPIYIVGAAIVILLLLVVVLAKSLFKSEAQQPVPVDSQYNALYDSLDRKLNMRINFLEANISNGIVRPQSGNNFTGEFENKLDESEAPNIYGKIYIDIEGKTAMLCPGSSATGSEKTKIQEILQGLSESQCQVSINRNDSSESYDIKGTIYKSDKNFISGQNILYDAIIMEYDFGTFKRVKLGATTFTPGNP